MHPPIEPVMKLCTGFKKSRVDDSGPYKRSIRQVIYAAATSEVERQAVANQVFPEAICLVCRISRKRTRER
jgi:hypothetical protein